MLSRITKEDHKDITKLCNKTFNDDYKTEINLGFKYTINNKLVGVILYSYYQRNYTRYCYIDSLAVEKAHRSKGIGGMLLDKVINQTTANIRLSIDISQPRSKDLINYYIKKKFKIIQHNKPNPLMELDQK